MLNLKNLDIKKLKDYLKQKTDIKEIEKISIHSSSLTINYSVRYTFKSLGFERPVDFKYYFCN